MTSRKGAEQAAATINSAAILLLRSLSRHDRQSGLSPARLSALSVVVFAGPRTIGELARAEQVSGATISRIVDGLEREGLVRRETHEQDLRAVMIVPTEAGLELMHAARDRRVALIADALMALPRDGRRAVEAAAPQLASVAAHVRDVR